MARLRAVLDDAAASEDPDSGRAPLLAVVAAAERFEEVLEAFALEALVEPAFGDGALWPEVAAALVDRAAAWSASAPGDAAALLGLAIRCTSIYPARLVRPDLDPELRDGAKDFFLDGIAQRRAVLAALAGVSAGAVAEAAMLLLACLDAPTDEEQALAETAAAGDDACRAALLASAVMAHRRGRASPLVPRARALLGAHDVTTRAGALACLALSDSALDLASWRVMADLLADATPLPRAWGWIDPSGGSEAVSELATQLCHFARGAGSELAVPPLASLAKRRRAMGPVILHAAFDARGRPMREGPLVLSDLDDVQRAAIAAFDQPTLTKEYALQRRLGLPYEGDVPSFLGARGTYFQTFPAPSESAYRGATHLGRLWYDALVGSALTLERAAEILVDALPVVALLEEIVSPWRVGRAALYAREVAEGRSDTKLASLVVERLLARDEASVRPRLDALRAEGGEPWRRALLDALPA